MKNLSEKFDPQFVTIVQKNIIFHESLIFALFIIAKSHLRIY